MWRAFPIIDQALDKPLSTAILELTNRCVVETHLTTTLRKMGHGMKCSLRFFPDGRVLRPTGIEVMTLVRMTSIFSMGLAPDEIGTILTWGGAADHRFWSTIFWNSPNIAGSVCDRKRSGFNS